VANEPAPVVDYTRRHLRLGWWSLLLFATIGLVLESLHGFKVRAYLDVSNETRRLMWTLAHAHGTLLAIINIVFGLSLRTVPELTAARAGLVSPALVGATVLMPVSFFLGGVAFYSGDPGIGILLLPVGALLLLAAIFWIGRGVSAPEARTRTSRR
jgi:hypothetical protein